MIAKFFASSVDLCAGKDTWFPSSAWASKPEFLHPFSCPLSRMRERARVRVFEFGFAQHAHSAAASVKRR